jgi:isopenicillin N synthase-like dioxygenase
MADEKEIKQPPPEFEPIPRKEPQTVCLANLTQEERLKFAEKLCCKKFKKHVEEFEACGGYERAKQDCCKEMAEEKEQQQKILQERNALLEKHANATTDALNSLMEQFAAYQKQTEERMNKLVRLISPPGAM